MADVACTTVVDRLTNEGEVEITAPGSISMGPSTLTVSELCHLGQSQELLIVEGKAAKGNRDCDQHVNATFVVVEGEVDHRGHEDDGMIGVIELDATAVDETSCGMQSD